MSEFLLCFVPLFVAVDPIGILPMFLSLTSGVERRRLRRVIVESVVTALVVALAFLAAGRVVLAWLGITIADFLIAGGALLFVISLSDLLSDDKRQRRVTPESLGAVPLGVPLIVGPAVLTTGMLLADQYGLVLTSLAVAANVLIAGLVFLASGFLSRILGTAGARILSKLASLLLAAIAVMMVRKGMQTLFEG